jgi:chaperonin cofactor prefoldin
MSLLGFDSVGSATINGLTEINANNVFSDVLYYDAGTVPVNVKTAIGAIDIDVTVLEGQMVTANANIATLQGQMTTANTNISTLQGQMTTANTNISTLDGEVNTLQSEMNTAQSDINTLQSEMNTAQSDINTLQSEMNDAQSDIGALYGITSTTAAAVAGLAVSQASQDVIITAHTASIGTLNGQVGTLQGQMTTAQGDITALQVKTVDMSWTTIDKTAFSTKVSVGGNVVLNTATPSTFTSGISCSTFSSTSATTDINIGQNLTTGDIFLGTTFIGPTMNVALNWGTGSNSGQLTFRGGSFTLASSGNYSQNSGNTFDTNIDTGAKTTGNINIGTNNTLTGNISIGTGTGAKIMTLGGASTQLNVGGTLAVADTTFIGRGQPSAKKLVMYDNNTGNNFEYLGMSVSTDGFNRFLNYNVDSVNAEHRFLYGNSSTTAKQILSLNPTNTALTTNAIDLRAKDITSANRDAGITISNNSSLAADLGTLGLFAGVINVGTQATPSIVNIGAIGSVVNIVGIVNIPNAQNFSMINSFFQQF